MGWIGDLLDISVERANQFYTWGWRLSAVGAAITVVAVALLWWGTRTRDRDFETQVAALHTRAATSEERSRELEKSNLTLQQNLEREQIERLKLEAAIAPRTISQDERKRLVTALKSFAGKRVRAESYVSDVESTVLGQQL